MANFALGNKTKVAEFSAGGYNMLVPQCPKRWLRGDERQFAELVF